MDSNPNGRTVLVCAMKEELRALEAGLGDAQARVLLRRAGVGPHSAANCAQALKSAIGAPKLLISTGFCGALVSTLKLGAIVVSHEIIDARDGLQCTSLGAQKLAKRFVAQLRENGIQAQHGRTVSLNEPVLSGAGKQELAQRFSAAAVDMESAALFAPFKSDSTICLVLRAVSDTSSEELPAEVAEFLTQAGRLRPLKVTGFIAKNPFKNIPKLAHLKRNSDTAAAALTAAWRILKTTL